MKKILLVLYLLFLIFNLLAEKVGALKEIVHPQSIEVGKDRIIIVQGASFYEYSITDLRFIRKFGEKGEGPGELKVTPALANSIKILPAGYFLEEATKIMYFSKDAKVKKEVKKKGIIFKTFPVADNFVAVRMEGRGNKFYLTLALFDGEMNFKKELLKVEYIENDTDIFLLVDTVHFAVYKDKIYAENSKEGFCIDVFDSTGTKVRSIKKQFPRIAVKAKDKKRQINNLRKDKLVSMMAKREGGWENFEKAMNFIFPDYFPQVRDLIVVNDKIYVSTFIIKNKREEYVVMDLKGNIINTVYLPECPKSSYLERFLGRDNRFYGISNDRYYYLKENETTEEWELHFTLIKKDKH